MKNNYHAFSRAIRLALFAGTMLLTFATWAQSNATVAITAPAGAESMIPARRAAFGPVWTEAVSGLVVAAIDTNTVANTACAAVTNDLTGTIALVDRGICGFPQKVLSAQTAGAVAVIVCNNVTTLPNQAVVMGGDDMGLVTVPSVMVSYAACQQLRMQLGSGLEVTLMPDGVAPTANEICATATAITPGAHTVDGITSGFGAVFASAFNARWYTYTPESDVVATVSSCAGTTDTRLVVLTGADCVLTNLVVVGSNDDCAADIFGSELSFIAQAGVRYFIYWDDRWEDTGFEFTLSESTLPNVAVTFNADMNNSTVGADGVKVAYAPNTATGIPDVVVLDMADADGDGIWSVTTELTVLDTIGYFFVNGTLAPENFEAVPMECGLPVPAFGINVRPLIVGGETDLPAICFSGCGPCVFTVDDCDEPFVFFSDGAETYTVGESTGPALAPHWAFWPGATVGAQISNEAAAAGGVNSFKMIGNTAQDVLLLLGDRTEGHYRLGWNMNVPAGNKGYFNIQHQLPGNGFWAFEVFFEGGGVGRLALNDDTNREIAFAYPEGAWFNLTMFFDLDNDEARVIVNRSVVGAFKFSDGTTGGVATDLLQLNSVNFYSADATNIWYFDNVEFAQIPDAGVGQYCYTATTIEPGTHTVGTLDCFGGGYFIDSGGALGYGAEWFEYTPTADGWIKVSNCGGGADSRVWIFSGECHDLSIVGVNDDECDLGGGDLYASYREAAVTAGTTYYIMWDDIWEDTGFDFTLEFNETALAEGAFCQSAIPVQPGEQTLEEFVGFAAVGGPRIGTFTTSTTPYSKSNWYSFTPETDGVMGINSCASGSDTYVFVYTGDCADFSSLTLVASNDDSCGASSEITDFAVTAGTTYFIEWVDRFSEDAFFWELTFGVATVDVTFQVDMAVAGADPGGVFVAGSFNGFSNQAMTDDDADGVYTVTLPIEAGSAIEYKFKNGPDGWESINTSLGTNCATGEFGNRVLAVGTTDTTLPEVCFAYCVDCNTVDVDAPTFDQGVSIFPNPTADKLNVRFELPETVDNVQLRMINVLGATVLTRSLGSVQQLNETLDVSQLPAGTYFLQLTSGNLQVNRKVTVE